MAGRNVKLCAGFAVMSLALVARAEMFDGVNWADEAYDYSANIQNYNGLMMDESLEWWLTGAPDADQNGNGYAWDSGDLDSVGGWRSSSPNEYIVMYWDMGMPDLAGDDLFIHYYCGPAAEADVYLSTDGVEFEYAGTFGGGVAGYMQAAEIDFAGLFDGCVHYVKVERATTGPQTGMFFDAFGGSVRAGDLDGDCDVDLSDLAALLGLYGLSDGDPGYDPQADFDESGRIDLSDLATLLGHYGESV